MKASKFPSAYKVWDIDGGVMLEGDEITNRGLTLASDGLPYFSKLPFDCVILWFTGVFDKNKNPVYEGDLCKCAVDSGFGSQIKAMGIMRWNQVDRQFSLEMPSAVANVVYQASELELLGNEFTHPELLATIMDKGRKGTDNG